MLIGYVLMILGLGLLLGIICWVILIAQLKFIFKTFWRCYYEVKEEQEKVLLDMKMFKLFTLWS